MTHQQRTVLIIDDSPTDVEMYRRYLKKDERYKYHIYTFEIGEEALNFCHEVRPNLILLDFLLPDIDGLEFLEQLQLINSEIPAIMLTGQGDEEIAVKAIQNGAIDYIVKGKITATNLLRRVDNAIEKANLVKQIKRHQQQQRLEAKIALRIRQSLNIDDIIKTAVDETRQFLNCDRVVVYKFDADKKGDIIAESVGEYWVSRKKIHLEETGAAPIGIYTADHTKTQAINNIYKAGFNDCYIEFLESLEIKANLIVPILLSTKTSESTTKTQISTKQLTELNNPDDEQYQWGLLVAHQCSDFREWEETEVELMNELAVQIAIAIQQAQLYQNLEQLNTELETKVQQRTQKLKQSEQKFRAIFNNTFQFTWLLTTEGILLEANQTALDFIDIKREDVINRYFWETFWWAISPETQEQLRQAIAQVAQEEFIRYEVDICGPNATVASIDFSLRPLPDETGQVTLLIAEGRDITEGKQIEAALRNSNAELEQASRLKDEFLASMSHELRTPMNAILGLSEALQEGVYEALNPMQLEALTTVRKNAQHLLELINDILDLSKIAAGKMELQIDCVEVNQLCEVSIDMIQPQAKRKNIQLNSILLSEEVNIQADERRIRQALLNLLINAVKFTPDGGRATLLVETNLSESTVSISVIDTGIGITPEQQSRLFQPFVQVDSSLSRRYSGTGLGLALVRRIVEIHSGSVSLESEVGKGSKFTIILPCSSTGRKYEQIDW